MNVKRERGREREIVLVDFLIKRNKVFGGGSILLLKIKVSAPVGD